MADGVVVAFDIPAALQARVSACVALAKNAAANAESWAKEKRPWKDRTEDARNSLAGFVIEPGEPVELPAGRGDHGAAVEVDAANAVGFGVAHRVDYGKWLETANDGQYAVLKPAVDQFRQAFLDGCADILGAKK
jgi:hypothetical protein